MNIAFSCSHIRFRAILGNLTNLKTLDVSYQCLSDDILGILCGNKNSELENITVTCDSSESVRHRIQTDSWALFRRKYPHLKVSFTVVEITTEEQFRNCIPSATELCCIKYRCGLSLQSENNLRTQAVLILHYLNRTFSYFLCEIRLEFDSALEDRTCETSFPPANQKPELAENVSNWLKICKGHPAPGGNAA
ncbi:uncharacterized protein CEXT_410441 [Caerostris extrusa]|uniref:Uncharacterized protein n=1 Tax=Caerostris extrusa TaxID=172846 RepID=A0AAV4VNP1_CAEEX|nr:uncharacterized protein CEXT_410441 [Caerostris extrusa]